MTRIGKKKGSVPLNAAQKLVAEHCVSDFYMIFHLKAAQHLVEEHYMKEIST